MSKLPDFFLLLLCLVLTTLTALSTDLAISNSKPGCNETCGNLTVKYPFGIGIGGMCSYSDKYAVYCNISFTPPKPFYMTGNIEILEITLNGQMRVRSVVGWRCSRGGQVTRHRNSLNIRTSPIVISDTYNKFTTVGCSTFSLIEGTQGSSGRNFTSGCVAKCSKPSDIINGSCSGIGCCQTTIPNGLKMFDTLIYDMNFSNTDVHNFNPCSYAFLAEEHKFRFNTADINQSNSELYNKIKKTVPVVLEWYIDQKRSCLEGQKNKTSYACQGNTTCTDYESGASRGYLCNCLPGYEGNPYLSPGCTDIDECKYPKSNHCSDPGICNNFGGSYNCSCPEGYHGDGLKIGIGHGCMKMTSNTSQFRLKLLLGMTFGVLICTLIIGFVCFTTGKRNIMKQREKYFEQNGGLLLKQQLSPYEGRQDNKNFKIYTSDELRKITNNYSPDRVLGRGGNGIVHKGILKDGSEVAVKTSHIVDQTQIEQFINEVVILTQINHCNVVKLLGCCLETAVPVLVYEYIPNGTLFEHIRKVGNRYWLSLRNCVRLALETADALSYLHSAANPPIIHRDIKSSNILIDGDYAVKVSDFGASRLIHIDQTRVITSVLGTHGYLDPEYLQTNQLTEKSDVYSFGVLLAELLTKQPPVCMERKQEERNLAAYFLRAMKEDRLLKILDPLLACEASEEQLYEMAKLVKNCLNVKGEDRPTMKEVAIRLEGLYKQITHAWTDENYEESMSLLDQQDLYPVSASHYNPSTGEASGSGNSDLYPVSSSHYNPSTGKASGSGNSLQEAIFTEINTPR